MANCKMNNVEDLLKYYEKLFYKIQYENTTINRFSEKKKDTMNKIKSKIYLLRLFLKNNIYYLSDTNDFFTTNNLRSSL